YCRFFNDGNAILNPPLSVTSVSNAASAVAQIPGNTFTGGTSIFFGNMPGMPQLSNRYVIVLSVAGDAVTLGDHLQRPINSTAYGVYTGGGTAASVYSIGSPY